jgi:glycosyltransferase involved in cell wall biosynthesis
MAQDAGSADAIAFTGHLDAPARPRAREAALLAMPSYRENRALAAEAMASGLPVMVSTR